MSLRQLQSCADSDPDLELRREFWQAHVPARVRAIFIAEGPPKEDRYFYYPESFSHDHLFLNLMKVVYPELDLVGVTALRRMKAGLLRRFQMDGFLVIDFFEERLPAGISKSRMRQLMTERQDQLLHRIQQLPNDDFTAFTVKATVLDGLSEATRRGIGQTFWDGRIYFPDNGRQTDFKWQMKQALIETGFLEPGI